MHSHLLEHLNDALVSDSARVLVHEKMLKAFHRSTSQQASCSIHILRAEKLLTFGVLDKLTRGKTQAVSIWYLAVLRLRQFCERKNFELAPNFSYFQQIFRCICLDPFPCARTKKSLTELTDFQVFSAWNVYVWH